MRYTITFEGQKAAHAVLTLGEVYESVKVWLNGKVAGEAICPPYRIYLGEGMIQEGENELVIEVTNTLVKANHKNPYDRYWLQEPTGLLGPVKIIYE